MKALVNVAKGKIARPEKNHRRIPAIPALLGFALLAIGAVACAPVASLEPIYTKKDLVFEPSALGVWYDEDNDAHAQVSRAGDSAYRLVYIAVPDKGERQLAMFDAHLVKLKDHLFLDLRPDFDDGVSRLSAWYAFSVLGVHQMALVKQLRPRPIITFMGEDYWKEHPSTIRHRRFVEDDKDAPILLTASTRRVQRFLRKAVKRGAFDKGESKWTQSQATALHFAAAQGNAKEIKQLSERGADVNARDEQRRTPLHWAVEFNQKQTVASLAAAGADVNAKDEDGRTPLQYAASEGSTEIVALLLAKGADVNAKTKSGRTPLHSAACGDSVGAVELLLARRADVSAKDNKGKTALDRARACKNEEFIELLKPHGSKPGE